MKNLIFLLLLFIPCIGFTANNQNIALVSVSSAYNEQDVPLITTALELKGYSVTLKYLNQVVSDFGYVNMDDERANALYSAMKDPSVDIIWFVRGGAGALNLLPQLKSKVSELQNVKPKTIVGFSDVTAIHGFVNKYLKWRSVHGVVASLNEDTYKLKSEKGTNSSDINKLEPIPSINEILNDGVTYNNVLPLNKEASKQKVKGELIGGNLTLVKATIDTEFQPDFKNKILFIEDVGDSFRHLDRDLHHLLMMKSFKNIKAVIFGQFYSVDPTDAERLIYKTVIQSFAESLNKPVYYFPFSGHGMKNKPLVLGGEISLDCQTKSNYCSAKNR